MLINEVFTEKNNVSAIENEKSWNLPDGSYTGKISDFKAIKDKKYIFIEIEVDGKDKLFVNMTPTYRYQMQPLVNVLDPLVEFEDALGRRVHFTIKNNRGNDGRVFSNIASFRYVDEPLPPQFTQPVGNAADDLTELYDSGEVEF